MMSLRHEVRETCANKPRKFNGDGLRVSMKTNEHDIEIFGDGCRLTVTKNTGRIRINGDGCRLRIDDNSGEIEYHGDGGSVSLGPRSTGRRVDYVGEGGRVDIGGVKTREPRFNTRMGTAIVKNRREPGTNRSGPEIGRSGPEIIRSVPETNRSGPQTNRARPEMARSEPEAARAIPLPKVKKILSRDRINGNPFSSHFEKINEYFPSTSPTRSTSHHPTNDDLSGRSNEDPSGKISIDDQHDRALRGKILDEVVAGKRARCSIVTTVETCIRLVRDYPTRVRSSMKTEN